MYRRSLMEVACQQDGAPYLDAVFNETVEVVEVDEGLDGET